MDGQSQMVLLNGSMSRWRLVMSDAPWGAGLVLVLIEILISDLGIGIELIFRTFADDSKLRKKECHPSELG